MSGSKYLIVVWCMIAAIAIGISQTFAAPKAEPEIPLTEAGEKFRTRYSDMLKALQTEIVAALPQIDAKKAAFEKAHADLATAQAYVEKAQSLVALAESKRNVMAKKLGAKALKDATTALAQAEQDANAAAMAVQADLKEFLACDKLDSRLIKCVVLTDATPRGLAEFAQQGRQQEALVEKLLGDGALMTQMVVADGAEGGKYGQAMRIYTDIQKAGPKAGGGNLQRLALAIALEHAVPIAQSNPQAQTDAPATVDAVKRYLHYEKAYLDGELDAGFKDLTVWDYRLVVNGAEPDWTLAWGREMLRNYRPDHIYTPDVRWRYAASVRTEVKYGSQDVKDDLPTLQQYQNIIMNGGVCGRRAFFGRFILRSFGVPTTAHPQTGHAALAHWTPKGWVICLGAGWGHGKGMADRGRNFGSDRDFLATTQARATGATYLQVLRAQWIGDVFGEKRTYGVHARTTDFWNGAALYRQRSIIEESKAVALASVGADIGEADESKEKEAVEAATMADADRKIVVGKDGAITIPAVACSKPTESTGKIRFMKSYLGGMQLHYNRLGAPEEFEYTLEAPEAGKYALTARVVTVTRDQHLQVAPNGATTPVDIAVPYTTGMWQETAPVEIPLVKGKNLLRFSRDIQPLRGLTIKEFTLRPVK